VATFFGATKQAVAESSQILGGTPAPNGTFLKKKKETAQKHSNEASDRAKNEKLSQR
jgi:hypothetical protein